MQYETTWLVGVAHKLTYLAVIGDRGDFHQRLQRRTQIIEPKLIDLFLIKAKSRVVSNAIAAFASDSTGAAVTSAPVTISVERTGAPTALSISPTAAIFKAIGDTST
jgi:hypothetical protein